MVRRPSKISILAMTALTVFLAGVVAPLIVDWSARLLWAWWGI